MKARSLSLIKKLLDSPVPLPLRRLQEEFKVSRRTIQNDLLDANDYLLELNLPILRLKRGKGLYWTGEEKQKAYLESQLRKARLAVYESPEERQLVLLLDIAFGQEAVHLIDREQLQSISKSTVDDDIRKLRQHLAAYSVGIASHPKTGLYFVGTEINIRTMLYEYLTSYTEPDYYGHAPLDQLFAQHFPQLVNERLDQLYQVHLADSTDDLYRRHFLLLLRIWLGRLLKGCQLQFDMEAEKSGTTPQDPALENFIQAVLDLLDLDIKPIEHAYSYRTLSPLLFDEQLPEFNWLKVQVLALRLVSYVENKMQFDFFQSSDVLVQGLYKHLEGLLRRVVSGSQCMNPLKTTIQEHYGELHQVIRDFCFQLGSELPEAIIEDEIAFLTIHFMTAVSQLKQQNQGVFRAVVVCHHGISTGRLLAETLKEAFPIEVLAVLNTQDLAMMDGMDDVLVFTTIALPLQEQPTLIVPAILDADYRRLIRLFLEQHQHLMAHSSKSGQFTQFFQELVHLFEGEGCKLSNQGYQSLEHLFSRYQLTVNKRELQPMIQDMLTDEMIQIHQKVDNWRQAISTVGKMLLEHDRIEARYIEAMIESVERYGPYIVLGPHLALAHARPEEGAKQLGLSVLTLVDGVSFGQEDYDPVRIVFCLSAVDAYSHLNIMKELVALINQPTKLAKLIEASDIEQFKACLFDKTN